MRHGWSKAHIRNAIAIKIRCQRNIFCLTTKQNTLNAVVSAGVEVTTAGIFDIPDKGIETIHGKICDAITVVILRYRNLLRLSTNVDALDAIVSIRINVAAAGIGHIPIPCCRPSNGNICNTIAIKVP